jgi:hypothetical protein
MTEIFDIVHSLGLKNIALEAGTDFIISLEWGKRRTYSDGPMDTKV